MGKESIKRSTFKSHSLEVHLNYEKNGEFFYKLGDYMGGELNRARSEYPEGRKEVFFSFWKGEEEFHVWAYAYTPPNQVASVSFVEITVDAENQDIRFKMYEHQHLIPNPKKLLDIVEEYKITQH